MKVGIENGTIRLVIDTTKLAYLLHESCYCNHRLVLVSRDQTFGLQLVARNSVQGGPLSIQPQFVLRGPPQRGPAHLLEVFP